jgi:hypothetical protein
MIYLGVFGYLILLDSVYSHVIVGIVNTHKDIISSYDLQILGITSPTPPLTRISSSRFRED